MSKNRETSTTEEKAEKEFSLSKFTPAKSTHIQRSVSTAGDFSVVNTEKHGRRVVISGKVLREMGSPKTVQFGFSKRSLVFGSTLNQDSDGFTIRYSGTKGLIYSGPLVQEITEKFGLDFTGRSMVTFPKAKIKNVDNQVVALVNILPKE